jgi:hypothetical protein
MIFLLNPRIKTDINLNKSLVDTSYLYKFILIALISGTLTFACNLLPTNFSMAATASSSLQLVTLKEESTNNYTTADQNQTLVPEDFQNLIRYQISLIFSEMLSEIDQSYASDELGLAYNFPSEWKGTLIKPTNSLIVSPPEVNVTSYLVNATEQGLYSFIFSVNLSSKDLTQEIFQTAMNSVLSEVFQSLEQQGPTISVSAISKDSVKSFQNLSGIEPPTKSLGSIWYEYSFSVMNKMSGNLTGGTNSLGSNKIQSINYSNINGIPTEISITESVLPQSNNTFKILGYLFLTQDNIIAAEYSATLENYQEYLPEFVNSMKSINITNPVPINEETIKQFVG